MAHAGQTIGRKSLTRYVLSLAVAATLIPSAHKARAQSPDNTKIIIGAGQSGISQLPLYVADTQGFFKKEGVDVTLQTLSGGTPSAMASFATGSVNILNLSAPELIQYVGKKVISGKAFAEGTDQSYDVVSAKSITSFQDIKGKIVGISAPNSADQVYFIALLMHNGMSAKDISFLSIGNPTNRLAGLNAGAVQVTALANNLREQSSKTGNVILKSGDSPVSFPINLFIASNDLINNHKPVLKKFVTALADAIAWMKANPEAAAATCAKGLGSTLEACKDSIAISFDRSITSKYTWSTTAAVNVEGMKSALEVMATIDPDTKNVKLEDIADTSIAGTEP